MVATRETLEDNGFHTLEEADADEALPEPTDWQNPDEDFETNDLEDNDTSTEEIEEDSDEPVVRVISLRVEGNGGNVQVSYEIEGEAPSSSHLIPGYKEQDGEWEQAHTTPSTLSTEAGRHSLTWHSHVDLPFTQTENPTFGLSWDTPGGENRTVQVEALDNRYVVSPRRIDTPRNVPAYGREPQLLQARDNTLYMLWKQESGEDRSVWFNRAGDGRKWDESVVEVPFGTQAIDDSSSESEEQFFMCADGKGDVAIVRTVIQGTVKRIDLQVSENYGQQWFSAPRTISEDFYDHHANRNVQCLLFDRQLLISWVQEDEISTSIMLLDTHLSLLHDAQPIVFESAEQSYRLLQNPRFVVHGNVFRLFWLDFDGSSSSCQLIFRQRISAYTDWSEQQEVEIDTGESTIVDFFVRSMDHLLVLQATMMESTTMQIGLYLSEDGGQQFSENLSPGIAAGSTGYLWANEPPALLLDGDHMVMAWQEVVSSYTMLKVAYSATAGQFWSDPVALYQYEDYANVHLLPPQLALGEGSRVVLTHFAGIEDDGEEEVDLRVFESSNHGASWSSSYPVADGLVVEDEDRVLQVMNLGGGVVGLMTLGTFYQRMEPRWYESVEAYQWKAVDPRPGHYGNRSNSYNFQLWSQDDTLYGIYIDDRDDTPFPYFSVSTDAGESWQPDQAVMPLEEKEDAAYFSMDFTVSDPPAVLLQTRTDIESQYHYGRGMDDSFSPPAPQGGFSGEHDGRILDLVHTANGPVAFVYAEPDTRHLIRVRTSTDGGETWSFVADDLEMKPGFDRGPYLAIETEPFGALAAWYAVRSSDDGVVYDVTMAHFDGTDWQTIQNSWLSGDDDKRDIRPVSLKNGRWGLLRTTAEPPYGLIELYTAFDGARGTWAKQEGLIFSPYDPLILKHWIDNEGTLHLLFGEAESVGTMLTYCRFDGTNLYWSGRTTVQPVVPDANSVRFTGFGTRTLWTTWTETFTRSRVLFGVFSHDGGQYWHAPVILSPDQDYLSGYDLIVADDATTHIGYSVYEGEDLNVYGIRWPALVEDLETSR